MRRSHGRSSPGISGKYGWWRSEKGVLMDSGVVGEACGASEGGASGDGSSQGGGVESREVF